MAFDPTAPADNAQISTYPSNERAQRLNTEALQQIEHDNTTGIHQVRVGTDAARDAITWPTNAGAIALWGKNDYDDLEVELEYLEPGTPATWHGIHDEFMARQNYWSKGQNGEWLDGTPGSSVTMDFNLGNFFRLTMAQDLDVLNPSMPVRPANFPAGTYFLLLEQSDAGPGGGVAWNISTWGANFRFPSGMTPVTLTQGAGALDLLQMMVIRDATATPKIYVEMVRDLST